MDYNSCYDNARSRYSNACSEINSCQNRLNELAAQRQNAVNRINQLKADIKNHQEAYAQMSQIMEGEDALNSKLAAITAKIGDAAENFSRMIISSDIQAKNLVDVYGEETARTKAALADIMGTLRAKRTELNTKLEELLRRLQAVQGELQNIQSQISSTQSDLSDWEHTRNSASYDMEYYRRKSQEEAYLGA